MPSALRPDIFPKVLVNHVAMAIVYEAVAQVVPPEQLPEGGGRAYVDRLDPDALNDLGRRMAALVDDLAGKGLIDRFRNALATLNPENLLLAELLADSVRVDKSGLVAESALQSIRNRTEPFLDPAFFPQVNLAFNRICAIWLDKNEDEQDIAGTGFLIGPDLVMTARHVVKDLLKPIAEDEPPRDEALPDTGGRLAFVFDYRGRLYRPFPLDPPPPGVTIEKAADDWLVWSSHQHNKDGIGHQFDSPPDIKHRFDCAIIRLARRVGEAATGVSGRRIRGWLPLHGQLVSLTPGQNLALLQHPGGGPQKFGNGRFHQAAPGRTRIWYSADADSGSSGAPCFDSKCRVVAFHNAGFPKQPEQGICTRKLNQGVALAPVVTALPPSLRALLKSASAPATALWSVAEDSGEPHPLLGRARLREAIETLAGAKPSRRVVVVEEARNGAGTAMTGPSGKSFSARVLRAMMRDQPALVIELDAAKIDKLDPETFLDELAEQAGLHSAGTPKPPRPVEERQLTRWWANDLPNWFAQQVEEAARKSGLAARSGDSGPGEEVVLAPIWIVIDDIHRAPPGPAMRECLAGLIGVTESTTSLPAGLRALRWLIIGHVPDFVRERSIEYELETISPSDIGEDDWEACCRAAFQAKGLAEAYDAAVARAFYKAALMMNPVLRDAAATGRRGAAYLETLAGAAALSIAEMIKGAERQ